MSFKEEGSKPYEGAFNVNIIYTKDGQRYLKRYPKENRITVELLRHEHDALGFSEHDGTCRRRSSEEQQRFLQHAASLGLKVPPDMPREDDKGGFLYPFIEDAQTLEDFLSSKEVSKEDKESILIELFADLQKAHGNGVIYGDRWSPNILIVPRLSIPGAFPTKISRTFVHIDFDLEINGPVAREFELAEAAFYALCAGRESVRPVLTNVLNIETSTLNFNYSAFIHFLEKFANLFPKDNKKYGDREKDVAALIAGINSIHTILQQSLK